MADSEWKNKLYFGDNLDIMREHIADESVDLIYLDPPFNSNATYNVLFAERNGTQSAAQIAAFDDTWHWDMKAEGTYHDIVTDGPRKLADLIQALRSFLGQNDMMAYLVMMAARFDEMQRVLKTTGSLYLHCDPTASHYLKLLLDAVFGQQNFRNEIVWQRTNVHNAAGQYGRIHDVLLFYTKGTRYLWNTIMLPYSPAQASRYRRDEQGRLYTGQDLTASRPDSNSGKFEWRGTMPPPSRGWGYTIEQLEKWWAEGRILTKRDKTPRMDGLKVYLDEMPGKALQSVWTDIPRIPNTSPERLGYPTQKPEALLERIIRASSNEDDVILDPFCGCGTTITVAERLSRRWIGIDITHLAITLMRHRLHDSFGEHLAPYEVIGDPKDPSSARALAEQDRYQFEWWALGKVAARPAHDKKKGADTGVDGIINFFDDDSGKAKKIIVQVKSGHVTRSQIGDLKGIMDREKASIAAFITLEQQTRPMIEEATTAGFYEPGYFPGAEEFHSAEGKRPRYPRVQILTIKELLEGKHIDYPRVAFDLTFKKAERRGKTDDAEQTHLL